MKSKSGIEYKIISANKIDLAFKKNKLNKKDWKKKEFSMQQNISYNTFKIKLKQNKKGKQNFYKKYQKSLKKTQIKHDKFIQDLEKKTSKQITLKCYKNKSKSEYDL